MPDRAATTIGIFVLVITLQGVCLADVEYSVLSLGTLGTESYGYALNASAQTTGKSKTTGNDLHAFFRDGGAASSLIDLGTLGGDESYGYGINDTGQVTGWALATSFFHAFRWTDIDGEGDADPGEMVDLGTLDGNSSGAHAVNANGQVAGWSQKKVPLGAFTFQYEHAFLWSDLNDNNASDPGEMIDLGTLSGNSQHKSYGYGMNDLGAVVGKSQSSTSSDHAFYWYDTDGNYTADAGEMIDLGTLGGSTSQANDVNNAGQVVGSANNGSQTMAALWSDTGGDGPDSTDILGLGDLGGGWSEAKAINDGGIVVGSSWTGLPGDDGAHAFLHRDSGTGMEDLNDLIDPASGWILQEAWGINDAGAIVGFGKNSSIAASYQAFLMLPVGEPTLAGDYNDNGIVDAADYTVWRDNVGQPAGTLPNDIDGVVIGPAQYDTWKLKFGSTLGASSLSQAPVPEPLGGTLLVIGSMLAVWSIRPGRAS